MLRLLSQPGVLIVHTPQVVTPNALSLSACAATLYPCTHRVCVHCFQEAEHFVSVLCTWRRCEGSSRVCRWACSSRSSLTVCSGLPTVGIQHHGPRQDEAKKVRRTGQAQWVCSSLVE